MPPKAHNATTLLRPRCPRCEYDLSGETDTWQSECPTQGQCPECGLTFEWTNIYTDNLSPGYVENARRFSIRRALKTHRRALNPLGFWNWVRIETEVRPKRLAASLAVWTAAWLLAALLINTAIVLTADQIATANIAHPNHPFGPTPPATTEWLNLAYFEVLEPPIDRESLATAAIVFITIAAPFVLMPTSYLLLDTTLARARVRRAHILRIATTALSPLPPLFAIAWTAEVVFASLGELAYGDVFWTAEYDPTIAQPAARAVDFLTPIIATILAAAPIPLYLIWLPLFYRQANHRYLRVPHATPIALLFLIIAMLATPVLQYGLATLGLLD